MSIFVPSCSLASTSPRKSLFLSDDRPNFSMYRVRWFFLITTSSGIRFQKWFPRNVVGSKSLHFLSCSFCEIVFAISAAFSGCTGQRVGGGVMMSRTGPHTNNSRSTWMLSIFHRLQKGQTTHTTPLTMRSYAKKSKKVPNTITTIFLQHW